MSNTKRLAKPIKLTCISDLHGHLPLRIEPCDILVIAGDICPHFSVPERQQAYAQRAWLNTTFRKWLESLRVGYVVACYGNHDWVGLLKAGVPLDLPCTILTDASAEACGLRFYGLPWQRRFGDWAFNLEEHELAEKYADIPSDVDVIVSHGPPYGFGDLALDGGRTLKHVGSPSLLARIQELQPPLVVYGHIHSGHGTYRVGESLLVNASFVDEDYRLAYPQVVVNLSGRTASVA